MYIDNSVVTQINIFLYCLCFQIDVFAIDVMSDDDLTRYLRRFGDRVAIKSFARQKLSSSCSSTKESLREKLIAKLTKKGTSSSSEHLKRSCSQTGNLNAKKMTRKLEIGWLHHYGHGNLKQVRSQSGGGTRSYDIEIESSMEDVLVTAKGLFFPNGVSKKGLVSSFSFYMADQTHTKLNPEVTVGELLTSTKVKTLRLYLVTCTLQSQDQSSSYGARLQLINENTLGLTQEILSVLQPEKDDTATVLHSEHNIGEHSSRSHLLEEQASNSPSLEDNVQVATVNIDVAADTAMCVESCQDLAMDGDPVTTLVVNNHQDSYLDDVISLEDVQSGMNVAPQSAVFHTVTINRTMILKDLVQVFKDPNIMTMNVKYMFINEKGEDQDGVSRDVYSGFWDEFMLKNADGEMFRVPVLSNDYGECEWEAIGRILVKGYKDVKYFPVSLAPACFIYVCFGEAAVSPEMLKESFLAYLPTSEKDIMESAIAGNCEDQDELLDILDRFECRTVTEKLCVPYFITSVAHRIFLQEPKYALDSFQRIGQLYWISEFTDVDSISNMYTKLEPTVHKVLALFHANPVTKEQNDAFKYLQRFVKGRNQQELKFLLRFLTGSDMICVTKIDIDFIVCHGAKRAPIFRTCGPVLQLPSTYVNFPDFRNEWQSILERKENLTMMIS